MSNQSRNGNGYARWGFIGSAISAGAILIGCIFWIGSVANQVSSMNGTMDKLDMSQSEFVAFKARTCQEFGKVETQVGAIQDDINLMRVDDLRFRGIVFPKLFEQPYPNAFYAVSIPREMPTCN